jgi:hypothetical protein
MSAGVGKTFRMLQEAHSLLRNGIDVKIGYIETHGREETVALTEGILKYRDGLLFIKVKIWKKWIFRPSLIRIPKLFWWMNWLTQTLKVPKIKKMAGCSGNSG